MRIFLRVTRLFCKYWKRALLAYFCLFAGAGLALVIPRLTGDGIDLALSSGGSSSLLLVALPLIIAATLLYTFTTVINPHLVRMAEDRYIIAVDLNGLNIIVLFFLGNALLNWVSYYAQIRAEPW